MIHDSGPDIELPSVPVESGERKPPLWLLVMVTLTGTLAMHMFVPALGVVARDLGSTAATVQSTITVYIVGLAIGQLAWGPLSDRVGRRPTLLLGLAIFTAAGVVCLVASSVQILIAARLVQALGGCSGMLLGRAIVRDTSGTDTVVARLATVQLMTMAGPGLAPLVGGLVAASVGWRWIFALLVLLGAAAWIATLRLLPETRTHGPGAPVPVRSAYMRLLRSPAFLACVLGGGCSTASFYAFLVAAPFLLGERLRQSLPMVGIILLLLVVGLSVGNYLAGRFISSASLMRSLLVANGICLASSLALIGQLTLGAPSVPAIALTMFFYCAGAGLSSPVILSKAMSIEPHLAGSASGIYGFGQMVVGALCTAAAGIGGNHGLAAACTLALASVVARMSFYLVRAKGQDRT